jgi:hypothetical protein
LPVDDADAYHFALFFRLPDHQVIAGDELELSFAGGPGHERLQLRPEGSGSLGEARRLTLSGFGYKTEEQARAAGQRAKEALSLAALESHVGIEWDERGNGGLDVWKGRRALGIVRFSGGGSVQTGVGAGILRERFASWLATAPKLTAKQRACADLLSDFHFDLSGRSRFLLCYAAIEELCSNTVPQGAAYREALAQLVTYLGTISADEEIKRRLNANLRHLENLQSRGRCKAMIREKLGPDGEKRFDDLTEVRKQIAHKGSADDKHEAFKIYQLARDLLFATMR